MRTFNLPPCQDSTVSSSNSTIESIQSEILMSELQALELYQNVISSVWNNIPETTWDNIRKISCRLLLASVRWAKSCSPLSTFTLDDQICLTRASWRELFILHVAQWLKSDFVFSAREQSGLASSGYNTLRNFKYIENILSKLRHLNPSSDEYACMKCIVLLKPDVLELDKTEHVDMLQSRAECALNDHINAKYPQNTDRFGILLQIIFSMRNVKQDTLEQTFFYQTDLKEPLESCVIKMYTETPTISQIRYFTTNN